MQQTLQLARCLLRDELSREINDWNLAWPKCPTRATAHWRLSCLLFIKCSAYCVGTIHYVEFRIIGSIYPYITELDPTIAMLTLCVLFSHLPANFFKISSVCVWNIASKSAMHCRTNYQGQRFGQKKVTKSPRPKRVHFGWRCITPLRLM